MIPMSNISLLFLGKADDPDCTRALEFCQEKFSSVTYCLGKWRDPLPEYVKNWEGDYIVSYLSRWVVPAYLLERSKKASINFHPASPEYPGIGCNNFALYEDAKEYGVTCHHMASKVDSGDIIAVKRFSVYPEDNVASILKRTYEHQLALFLEIVTIMAAGQALPKSEEKWTRPPFTRKQFDELFRITPNMELAEINRRIRAISYKNFQPFVEIQGHRFEYKPVEK